MNQERVFKVLLGPHVSEKATVLADKKGQFVFKVATDATKLEIQDFAVETPKTKDLLGKLNNMSLTDVLIVSDAVDQNLYLAARNLPHVDVRDVQGSDPVSLIAYDKVLITVSAVKKFEELLG